MAQVRHTVTAPGKAPVDFYADENANDGQLQQLAAQALAGAFPNESFITPVLDAGTRKSLERAPRKLTQDEILERQGELTTSPDTFRSRDIAGLTSVLSGLGFGDQAIDKSSQFVNDIYDWTPVGSVEAGFEAAEDAGAGRYLDATGNAIMAGLDLVPEVGQGASALAMFLGRNAKTANLDMLRKAEQMAEQGAPRDQILRETGWFNQHGDWKFEISDERLGINHENLPKFGEKVPLRNVVSHPELEAAYPEAWQGLKFKKNNDPTAHGSWVDNGIGGLVTSKYLSDDQTRGTVAHELQHFVQSLEGFPQGASPSYSLTQRFSGDEAARVRQEYSDALEERFNRLDADEMDPALPALEQRINELEAKLKTLDLPEREAYLRVAGETEARNTQARLRGTERQRDQLAPWDTQEFPDEKQFIIRDRAGTVQSSADFTPYTDETGNPLTPGDTMADMPPPNVGPGKQAMKTAKTLSTMAGSPAGGGKKLTTRQIKALSEDYLRQVEQGAAGADWYQQSGRSMMSHMGENEPLAIKFAGATGITSSQTPVLTNLEHAVRGHNQAIMGDPVRTGMFPTAMGKDIQSIYDAPDMSLDQLRNLEDPSQFGMKRTPFIQQNLMYEGFEPGQQSTARAVHDIWDMRARGYQGPGGTPFSTSVSPAQHRWADIQDQGYLLPEANYRMLGDRADWDTGRAQAAAWVGNKIDALMREGKSFDEAQKIAVTDYSHGWDRLYANHSWESAPGSNTGHMEGFNTRLPWEEKQAYHDEVETAFLNPEGQSRIALGYGAPTGRSYDTTGLYEGVVSPGTQDQIAVARAPGSQEIDPSSRSVLDAVAATQGLLGAQKGAAWNFQSPAKSSQKAATGFRFDMDRTLSLEDIERFGPQIQEAFPAGNVGLLPDPAGMKLVKFWDEPGDDLAGFARRMQHEGGLRKPFPTTQSGNYMENAWDAPEGRFGDQYVNVLQGLDIPNMAAKFDSFAPDIARRMVEDIDPALMKRAGLTGSADIERLRKTIANEGWQGLVRLVESQKGSVDAKAALLAAVAGLAGAGVGVSALSEAQP